MIAFLRAQEEQLREAREALEKIAALDPTVPDVPYLSPEVQAYARQFGARDIARDALSKLAGE